MSFPAGGPIPIALPASDPITKTLLTLTRTCKLTYSKALTHLYAHCLYIDSFKRLKGLTKRLEASILVDLELQVQEDDNLKKRNQNGLRRVSGISKHPLHVSLLKHATSLYLSPYPGGLASDTSGLPVLAKILDLLSPKLKRLVLSLPNKCPEYLEFWDARFQPMIPTLAKLTSLEVFCSVNDNLWMYDVNGFQTSKEMNAWTHWPNLRVLALYDAYPHLINWKWWGEMAALETLIFPVCDGTTEDDYQQEWKHLQADRTKQKMKVVLVDVESGWDPPLGHENWSEGDSLQMKQVLLPANISEYNPDRTRCKHWVKRRLLDGNETIDDRMVEHTWAEEHDIDKDAEVGNDEESDIQDVEL